MIRASYLVFGIIAYLIFFVTFLYFAAFVGNFPAVAITVDRGGPFVDTGSAVLIDIALIALFGIQHSVMARPGFKAAWTRVIPAPLERSIFVLASSLVLIVLILFWRPIPAIIWSVDAPIGQAVLWALFATGWLVVLFSTFLINHFELFGLQQVWNNLWGQESAKPLLREPALYRWVRHPLYLGFLFALWAIPVMTAGHLLLAVGLTAYILIGIRYEEKDLIGIFGREYEIYRNRVGMLLPKLRRGG